MASQAKLPDPGSAPEGVAVEQQGQEHKIVIDDSNKNFTATASSQLKIKDYIYFYKIFPALSHKVVKAAAVLLVVLAITLAVVFVVSVTRQSDVALDDTVASFRNEAGVEGVSESPPQIRITGAMKEILKGKNFVWPGLKPVTDADFAETLQMVQRTVNADRLKLSLDTFKNWKKGDQPLRLLLISTWGSGSNFLQHIIANHPLVFQHHQPLLAVGDKQVRSGREAFKAQQLVHKILDCQFDYVQEYLVYMRQYPFDSIVNNRRVWDSCEHGPNVNVCFNSTFLTETCSLFPIQFVNTVRLRLNLTQLLLNDEKLNGKVVFLVRDPRETMRTRRVALPWCHMSEDCFSPEVMCTDLQNDLKVAGALEKLYPTKYMTLKFEDLVGNAKETVKKLFDFLSLEFTQDIERLINDPILLFTDYKTVAEEQERELLPDVLSEEDRKDIEDKCQNMIKTLSY